VPARVVSETSTGGIIASLLSLGHRVDEIRAIYLRLCQQFFRLCQSAARYE
jgi:predicted acylesterase/phospholipase RssA